MGYIWPVDAGFQFFASMDDTHTRAFTLQTTHDAKSYQFLYISNKSTLFPLHYRQLDDAVASWWDVARGYHSSMMQWEVDGIYMARGCRFSVFASMEKSNSQTTKTILTQFED